MNGQQSGRSVDTKDWSWPFWPILPIYPYGQRRTLRTEILQDTIWTFDQVQGIFYVVVPIRMTVVRLIAGGLLVYAPIAPTPECIRLVQELVAQHGDVKHIVLPTISGLEHKVFVGPFARRFPTAHVWVAPGQWSFPVNLPLSWLGLPGHRTAILPPHSDQTPFGEEFDYATLGPIDLGPGRFAEVALLHRRSHTLLITDAVLSIPDSPPAIVEIDPYPLLFHAKEDPYDVVEDTPENRRKGWQRIALFAFYFRPDALDTVPLIQAFRDSFDAPDRSKGNYFGIFPFRWKPYWQRSFASLSREGRLLVAPILQTLILNRAPQETIAWANAIAGWTIERIIPCHLQAPIAANAQDFRQAFTFLEPLASDEDSLPHEDVQLLRTIDEGLYKRRITPPPKIQS